MGSPGRGGASAGIATRIASCYDDIVNIVTLDVSPVNIVYIAHISRGTMHTDHTRPRAYHHGDLRNALIEAGIELLAEGGAAALDLRKVARKAGVSHAAPYRHFADKQALIAAINTRGFELLLARIEAGLAAAPPEPAGQLHAVALTYVSFARESPWLMREMFSGINVERESYPELYAASKQVYIRYADIIRQGQAAGAIAEGNADAQAAVLWSLLHGLAMLIIENQMRPYSDGPEGLATLTHFGIETLIQGLGRR